MSRPDPLPPFDFVVTDAGRRPDPVYLRFFKSLRDTLFERAMVVEKAGAATTDDIPAGEWRVFKDTTGPTVSLIVNDGGVLKSVALT